MPPNILFVMPSYPPDVFGGAEQHSKILAMAMQRLGARVTIMAPTQIENAAGVSIEDGVNLVRFHTRAPPFLGGRNLGSLISWWRDVYGYIAKHRDDIDVIAIQHLRLHSAPAIRAAVRFRKTVSGKLGRGGVHFDLTLLRGKRLPIGRWLAGFILRSPILYVANSEDIVNDLLNAGARSESILRIPNGVECPPIPSSAYTARDGAMRFVFAGRLDRQKGIRQLVTAFGKVRRDHPRVRLDIFGDGPLAAELKTIISERGMGEGVRLHGLVEDRSKIFGDAAFFILPSDSEGMSNALLEAMAHGVVPCTTAVSGARDLIEEGRSGFLLEGNDVATIEAMLRRLVAMDEPTWRRYAEVAREKVMAGFDINQVGRRYLDAYQAKTDRDQASLVDRRP